MLAQVRAHLGDGAREIVRPEYTRTTTENNSSFLMLARVLRRQSAPTLSANETASAPG